MYTPISGECAFLTATMLAPALQSAGLQGEVGHPVERAGWPEYHCATSNDAARVVPRRVQLSRAADRAASPGRGPGPVPPPAIGTRTHHVGDVYDDCHQLPADSHLLRTVSWPHGRRDTRPATHRTGHQATAAPDGPADSRARPDRRDRRGPDR